MASSRKVNVRNRLETSIRQEAMLTSLVLTACRQDSDPGLVTERS